ncbi:unnamed protein product [Ectocarpus sp. 12 AP-2014]
MKKKLGNPLLVRTSCISRNVARHGGRGGTAARVRTEKRGHRLGWARATEGIVQKSAVPQSKLITWNKIDSLTTASSGVLYACMRKKRSGCRQKNVNVGSQRGGRGEYYVCGSLAAAHFKAVLGRAGE